MSRARRSDDLPAIFAVADAKAAGITRGRLQRKALKSVVTGVKQIEDAEISQRERTIAIARSVPKSVIASISVAQIAGWRLPQSAARDTRIHLLTTDCRQIRRRGIKSYRYVLDPSEYLENVDYRITTAERTFLDLGALLSEEELIIVADGLLCTHAHRHRAKQAVVDAHSLQTYLEVHRSHPGKRKCLRALARAVTGSDSPQETRLRLLLEEYGIKDLIANPLIRGEYGEYLFEPDLADFENKLSIQYEGEHHSNRQQIRRDNERALRTASAGWIEIKIFSEDLREYEEYLGDVVPRAVKRVLEARRRSA